MTDFPQKHVWESKTEQIQIILSEHINGYNRLFGGKLVEWIDVVAAVVARRHSGCNVTTVCIDHLNFKSPGRGNDTVVLQEMCIRDSVKKLEQLYPYIQQNKIKGLKIMSKVSAERVFTLFPGLAILLAGARIFGAKKLQLCKYGVREGYLLYTLWHSGKIPLPSQLCFT